MFSVISKTHETLHKINFSIFKSVIHNKDTSLKKFYRKASLEVVPKTDNDSIKKVKSPDFSDSLVKWAVQNNISHSALSKLLTVLKEHGIKDLPVNSKALLQAKENEIEVSNMAPGVYMHFGFQKNLKELMLALIEKNIFNGTQISVSVFIDQLPFVRLTNQGLWVILGSIEGFPKNIFFIGAYWGFSNPKSSNLFLSEFVNEAKDLTEKGLEINNGIFYNLKIKRLICDAPAKSFVLNIKNYLSYSSCVKCNIVGEFKDKAMSFLEKGTPKKDENFENDKTYRTAKTCLLEIPGFGVVSNITIDYMHLVCLGVVKKLISIWLNNDKYWTDEKSPSNLMKMLDFVNPCEFHKKQNTFKKNSAWLAQDLRLFLLYYGPVILKNRLKDDYYNHFLLLHVACRLLCLEASRDNIDNGREYLNSFVENYKSLYRTEHITHNIHGLYHLADECISHGTLDNFSSFPFEEFLTKLKRSMLEKKKKLIPHTILRESYDVIFRRSVAKLSSKNVRVLKKIKKSDEDNLFKNFSQYEKLFLRNFTIIPSSVGDNIVFLSNNKIIEVSHVLKNNDEYLIGGKEYSSVCNFHSGVYGNLKLGTFVGKDVVDKIDLWPVDFIEKKLMKIPIGGKESVFIGLLDENY